VLAFFGIPCGRTTAIAGNVEPKIEGGGLTTEEVKATIVARLNDIRHCYERFLQRSPNASRKITVLFVISKDGTVASARTIEATILAKQRIP
jgi:hypothetical protein